MLNQLYGSNGQATIDLTQGLIAHYLLNNNADDIAGTYDGTPSGGVDFQGDMASFDGIDDYVSTGLGVEQFRDEVLISYWRKNNGLNVGTELYELNDNNTNSKLSMFVYSDGHLAFYFRGTTDSTAKLLVTSSVGFLQVGEISHIVLRLKINGIREIWIDGVNRTETTPDTFTGWTQTDANNLLLGANGVSVFDETTLSNIRIYNTIKDQTFIDALYAEGYYPKPLPLPTTDGLVAHYPLTGTAEDTTGNYDGTELADVGYVDDSEFGSVLDLNGTNTSAVITPYSLQVDAPHTISLWVKWDALLADTDMVLYGYFEASSIRFYFGTWNGACLMAINDEFEALVPNNFVNGVWYHVMCSIDGVGNCHYYIDNVLMDSTVYTQFTNTTFTPAIGMRNATTKYPTDGKIRDTRVYNRLLTAQERTDIYNYEKNFRPIDIDDGLVAYYPLANNSLDNYKNQYDGADTSMTYDGLSGVFNGTSSRIGIDSTSPISTSVAISFWIKAGTAMATGREYIYDVLNAERCIIARYSTLGNGISFYDTSFVFREYAHIPAIGVWEHIVLSSDGTKTDLYVDGEFSESLAYRLPRIGGSGGSLGRINSSGSNYWLHGDLSNVRLYEKAITAEQVQVINNTEKGDFI